MKRCLQLSVHVPHHTGRAARLEIFVSRLRFSCARGCRPRHDGVGCRPRLVAAHTRCQRNGVVCRGQHAHARSCSIEWAPLILNDWTPHCAHAAHATMNIPHIRRLGVRSDQPTPSWRGRQPRAHENRRRETKISRRAARLVWCGTCTDSWRHSFMPFYQGTVNSEIRPCVLTSHEQYTSEY